MAEGDAYFNCEDRNVPGGFDDFFPSLIIEDADGNPCLKTCGGGGSDAGTSLNPVIEDQTNSSGTVSGAKSVTFSFPNGKVVIQGIELKSDHSPLTFSNDAGLGDITFDSTQSTTGITGGTELKIFKL